MKKQVIKLNESQLRNIIRESLDGILKENIFDEGRPRTKPSYWEVEDYREVPGVDLVIDLNNIKRMKDPRWRNPDNLIKILEREAVDMRIDEQNNLHAYFYHGNNQKYIEYDLAEDERFWYEILKEPTMKGIAKQVPVMLYEHVPDFEEIWNEETASWKEIRDRERREEGASGSSYGKGEPATSYNTVPTIGTLGE